MRDPSPWRWAIANTSPAVATSSWAVASALGYAGGEEVPLDMVASLVSRMTAAVSVPLSIDLEAGYGDTPDAAAESVTEILRAGAIGIKGVENSPNATIPTELLRSNQGQESFVSP